MNTILELMETKDLITLGVLLVTWLGGLATIYTNFNVRIAEIIKDVLAIRRDMEDHKMVNKLEIKEIKDMMQSDKMDNREDHLRILETLNKLSSSIADLRVDLAKNTKTKK
jgi:hypothetical protein